MNLHPRLRARLEPLARRQQRLRLWLLLTACWTVTGLAGLGLMGLEQVIGWSSWLTLPAVALFGVILCAAVIIRAGLKRKDWRSLARQIEASHPELEGRLLTAVQQEPRGTGELSYLQQRVLDEAIAHHDRTDWSALLPGSRVALAQAAHLAALVFLGVVMWGLRVPGGHGLLVPSSEVGVTVTPGDVTLERGSSLVVMAQFTGRPPGKVDLIVNDSAGTGRRIPLVRSLADPLFGAAVPEVASNLVYHLEYAGQRTRDFKVTVFEYPKLERADADITFPAYTGQPPKHINDTRRLAAVEGSRLDLVLQLNKTISRASLVCRDAARSVLPLLLESNRPLAVLKGFSLERSAAYDLQLVDSDGRTNKVPAQFVFDALKNRQPELTVAAPRGDSRPSALEEIAFEGTVWDDFGVQTYGLAYSVPDKELKVFELGHDVPAREKRPFQFLLRLEDLGVQPDDLLSWFIWADDIGPDGKPRRTTGDLFFAEVRPFEEIFRQGQSMSGGEQQQQQDQGAGQGSAAGRVADLQKQIINATWNLFRRIGVNFQPGPNSVSETNRGNDTLSVPVPSQRSSSLSKIPPRLAAVSDRPLPPPHRVRGTGGGRAGSFSERRPLFNLSAQFAGQTTPSTAERSPGRSPTAPRTSSPASLADDLGVVTDAQSQAIDQAESAQERQQDPRTSALWEAAIQQMERALDRLRQATNSPAAFREALAAEQAAYQALLKLQEREYSVTRGRNRQSRQGARQQQLQRELDQLDLAKEENRYETERQAQPPQSAERREQLQIMNRLQELARRQQDLNQRLKELQTALQEARTEQEREDIRRQLKRLEEQEQQLLADADEARQRMDRPENQSRLTEQRRQLDQAREDLQRATEATRQGQPSQALASGTRAQRQFEQIREDMRRQSAGEFEDELKQMRAEARDLARQQEEVRKSLEALNDRRRRTLSDSDLNQQALDKLARQAERLTNLVENATQLSQQAEAAEPLMSRELYDTLRKFSQEDGSTLKQFQEELMNRGMTSRELYQRMKRMAEQSRAKALDLTSEMLRQGFLPDAATAEQRARAGINDLRRGVERAAQSVLGDDAESLRLATQELDRLAAQLQQEMTQASGEAEKSGDRRGTAFEGAGTNQPVQIASAPQRPEGDSRTDTPAPASDQRNQATRDPNRQPTPAPQSAPDQNGGQPPATSRPNSNGQANRPNASGPRLSPFDRLFDGRGGGQWGGPITGDDFAPWSDGLRNVEELVETPSLRTDIARARERARQMRQDYKRDQKKPDWAVVRLQVFQPLVEVRDAITEELARREPRDDLVPIDRDPVPGRYSELVRRYYEQLGKDNNSRESTGAKPER